MKLIQQLAPKISQSSGSINEPKAMSDLRAPAGITLPKDEIKASQVQARLAQDQARARIVLQRILDRQNSAILENVKVIDTDG